jgi:phospholipid transport system substrate-binding protein
VQLEPVIRRTFDVPAMARLSVGPSWAGLTEAQRQQITDGFGRYISAIYADRFDSYAGQKLQVTDEQSAAAGVIVHSQIVKANGEPVKVDYRGSHIRNLGSTPRTTKKTACLRRFSSRVSVTQKRKNP